MTIMGLIFLAFIVSTVWGLSGADRVVCRLFYRNKGWKR